MDKKHLVIVLFAVASAFGLASCKSSAGPLSGKGGEPMPAANLCLFYLMSYVCR